MGLIKEGVAILGSAMNETENIYPLRYYAIGHSYLSHGPFEGWQTKGFWGMAASEPKADYFHRVQQRLQESLRCSVRAIAENYATYERLCTVEATRETYENSAEYAQMRQQLQTFCPNLITVFIGGGNTIAKDPKSLTLFFRVLYGMIAENKPEDAVVICPFSNKRTLMCVELAREYGFVPVDLCFLHDKGKSRENPYYALAQYPEYDEAAKAGAIEFRTHPGDFGHDTIAKHIVEACVPGIKQQIAPVEVCLPRELILSAPKALSGREESVRLEVTARPAGADNTVEWSVDNSNLAVIDRDGCLTAMNNGAVTVTARSTVCPEITATVQIALTGQTPWYTLTYQSGTEAPVSRIPEPIAYLKGAYSLKVYSAAYLPKRIGYQFMGWSDVTVGDSRQIVESVQMDRDRTVRANWRVADCWDFDTVYDCAGVRMGGFNVRYEDSIARVSSAPGTGAAVYHDTLQLPAENYSRFVVRMRLDCEEPEKGVCLCVTTTEGKHSCFVQLPPQSMQDIALDISQAKGIITDFRIEPQMTDCCIYVDKIAFEA